MENINGAVLTGIIIGNNENIGYTIGATLANSNETDCSDFVWWCLKQNGFNVPATRWNTTSMIPYLQNYEGFTHSIYNANTYTPKHGDILVYDEGGGENGHTFFVAENVTGYATEDSYDQSFLNLARVEASSSRGETTPGDHRKNGTGAFWEVWTHSYSAPASGHTWHVFRWNGETPPPTPGQHSKKLHLPVWLMYKITNEKR